MKVLFTSISFFLGLFLLNSQNITDIAGNTVPNANTLQQNAAMVPDNGVMFYFDQGTFDTDCGMVQSTFTEDFEDNLLGDNSVSSGFFPLNSSTNDAIFSLGSIENGFEMDNVDPIDNPTDDYAIVTTGNLGALNDAVGPNSYSDSTVMNFSVPVNFVTFEVFDPISTGDILVEVYSAGGLLGSTSLNVAGTAGVFVGMQAAEDITRVEIKDNNGVDDTVEIFYTVSYGFCSVEEVIPTMSQWGIIILSVSLSIVALVAIRKRKYIFG